MTPDRLSALAARWNRRWALAALGLAAAAALAATVTMTRWAGLPIGLDVITGLALGGLALLTVRRRRPLVDARTIARHLDRTVPDLGDSTELVLADAVALSGLERLQRERVGRVLDSLAEPPLPHPAGRRLARGAAVLVIAAAALALLPFPSRSPRARSVAAPPAAAPSAAPSIDGVDVSIDPPRYVGRRRRHGTAWDLDQVEESGHVTWRVRIGGAVEQAALLTTAGDSLPLQPTGDGGFTVALTATTSRLYQVVATGPGGRAATPYHRLLVVADAPPVVTVVRPDLRTAVAADAAPVAVEVLVHDDYGLRDADIVATLTSGQGEGVKFREQRLSFDRKEVRRGGGWRLTRALDLRALGLGPGDELYFSVVARDSRVPLPNETRSETHFVAVADTGSPVLADFSGIAIDILPEYFRSQRQIIIDTERLLAERRGITSQEFRDRSQNIGLDQHLLRLRYGEIVGDETVIDAPLGVDETGAAEVHEHDTEENATRLAQTVKTTLKAALQQMWDAELRLRTSDPQGALPYEYRALELLKQVQQSARLYVQRTGFAPPPLEPDRNRFTGELDDIASRSATTIRAAADSLPAVRRGLALLDRLAGGAPPAPGDVQTLELAGREIARLAADDPARHLTALGLVRTLITALARDGSPCPGCVAQARQALWSALPVPAAAPARAAVARDGVARRYFELLETLP